MRRGKEKLLAGLLTVGMIVSSMFSPMTPVYAAELPETTESQVYEETDEAASQSAEETQEAKETESTESTEASNKESDIESSESINHTPETESTESVESTEGGETGLETMPEETAESPADENAVAETEPVAETRCVVEIEHRTYELKADEDLKSFVTRVVGGPEEVDDLTFISGTVTAEDLRSINKEYTRLRMVKVDLDGDLTFKSGNQATTVLPSGMFSGTSKSKTPQNLAILSFKGFTELGNDSVKYLPNLSNVDIPDVTTIGNNVFRDCTSMTNLDMPKVQTIGSRAFDGCRNFTGTNNDPIDLTSVRSIGSSAFNNIAGVIFVKTDNTTPPQVNGSIFSKAKAGSELIIPAGALSNYLPKVVPGELYNSASGFEWNNLVVNAPDYSVVTYTSPQDKYLTKTQLVKEGQSIGEKPFAVKKNGYKFEGIYSDAEFAQAVDASYVPSDDTALYYKWGEITVSVADKNGDIVNTIKLPTDSYNMLNYSNLSGTIKYELYPELPEGAFQWNTKADGTGQTILGDTKIYENITLYPIYKDITNVTVKVNDGAALGGANLALAIGKAGADSVTKLEVVSGKMTKADYLWMNKGIMDSIETLIIADGVESENKTVPIGTAQSAPNLHHLEIHGVETMESAAIMARNLHTLILPDVKKTGSNSWGDTTNSTVFIKTVDLSSIEELGEVSFSGQNQLPELNMPNLRSVGEGCFRNAGAVSIITNQVPEIGKSSQLKGNTFEQGSTITVPAQVYDEYMKTHDSEFLDSKKYVKLVRGKALAVVTVKINGTQYDAASVEDAVAQSGVDAGDVESIEFVSGIITAADLTYMKETTNYLTTLKMNLGENLKLTDAEGAESTVLPASAFKGTRLEIVEIGGFTEIKADAFNGCTHLESVAMPDMEIIGDEAFYYTDNYETIVLPASIKKLDNPNFGKARNGYKELDVTMEGTTPPEATGRIFIDARSGMIKVPEGALPNYLPNIDLTKWFNDSGDLEWEGLKVVDPAYHFIHYKGANSWDNKYAYVKNDEKVTEARIPEFKNEGMELVGWNTAKDGSGKALDADTVMSKEWDANFTVYAQWAEPAPDVVVVKINGTEYSAKSVEDAVAKSGVDAGDVESIEFVSGIITAADLTYMKETTNYLTTLKMNLGENLKLTDAEGAETTELPAGAFKSTRLESVEIGGFTKVGARAFESCTKLENVAMPNVKEIEKDAFYRTDAYETIILPASLETMTDPGFGGAANGKKTLDVTMEGSVPPTISGRVFGDAKGGTVTVPAGALPNYLTNLDFAKWFNTSGDSEWGGLPVIDPAYHLVHYKGVNSWDNKYAYVKDGETVTEDRIPVFENGDKVLVGWNTEADGTGSALDAETEMNKEWAVSFTVYAQWADQVTVTFDVDGTTTGVKVIKGETLGDKMPSDPSKEDYTFKGWNTKADGTGEAFTAETKAEADMTVYAVFEKIVVPEEKVTVTFDVEGQKTSVEVIKGEAIGINMPKIPEKDGYTFTGWNVKADGTGAFVTAETKIYKDMTVYAIFEKNTVIVVPPIMDSVTAENGKVTIVLKDKPTKAPTLEDMKLQMNLNGTGNKEIKITGFTYDDDKTIVLTFDKVAQTDKTQKFTLTVTLDGKSVTTGEIIVSAKTTGESEKPNPDKDSVKTGDNTPIAVLAMTMVLAAGIVAVTLVYKRKRIK